VFVLCRILKKIMRYIYLYEAGDSLVNDILASKTEGLVFQLVDSPQDRFGGGSVESWQRSLL